VCTFLQNYDILIYISIERGLEMLSDVLKKERKTKKLSQKKLADKCGLSPSYIQQLELGQKTNPSLEAILKLSFALGIDVKDLMTPEEEKKLLWSADIEKDKDAIIKHYGLDFYRIRRGSYTEEEFKNETTNNKVNIQLESLKLFVDTVVTDFEEIPSEKIKEISMEVASWIREYVEMTAKSKIQELIEKYSIEDVK